MVPYTIQVSDTTDRFHECKQCHRVIPAGMFYRVQEGGCDDVGAGESTCTRCWPLDPVEIAQLKTDSDEVHIYREKDGSTRMTLVWH